MGTRIITYRPFYFDENTMPDLSLSETTIDGGVAFLNVPNGVVTNASPPYGLQAVE